MLFNIAALYFRVIGNPYHAVECLRRALHFSPPHARDVALIQLSNILRRFGHVSDAAVVMRTALEQHPLEASDQSCSYFVSKIDICVQSVTVSLT